MKHTVQTLDGRKPSSLLSKMVLLRFSHDQDQLIAWANQANSTGFASLAPIVIEASEANDAVAKQFMQQAGQIIEHIIQMLQMSSVDQAKITLPCALVGGMASFIEPHLSESIKASLSVCQSTPDAGASLLLRKEKQIA
jgi:N-acetylglucosamine kinase-like BadF-type ATPase